MNNDVVYLTVDVEWAHDEVLSACIDFFEAHNLKATFFVTHDTALLERLRKNPLFELGIHPNFNSLLEGSSENARDILARLMDLVPEAKSVRSHSLVQSSRLLSLFHDFGLTHEANLFIPYTADIPLKTWKQADGLIRVPHFWEDDLFWHDIPPSLASRLLEMPGLKVFDFHPLSLYLNIDSTKRYESSRPFLNNIPHLETFINPGRGVRTFLEEVIRNIKARKMQTEHIKQIT